MNVLIGIGLACAAGMAVALRLVRRERLLPRPPRVPREFRTGEWETS